MCPVTVVSRDRCQLQCMDRTVSEVLEEMQQILGVLLNATRPWFVQGQ